MVRKPYIVLGTYVPPFWKAWKVGEDLTAMTKQLGLKPHCDPAHGAQTWPPWYDKGLHAEVKKRTPDHPGGEDWHKDGDTTPGSKMNCAIVLWSSNTPTQFRIESEIFQPKPFEVVLFKNLTCSHRRPPNALKDRFLFRQRVVVPTHIALP